MKKLILTSFIVISSSILFGQDKAFEIYNKTGKKTKYSKVIKEASNTDVLFFGEIHNDPIAHWLQLEITKSLYKTNKLILGAEMFERDNQQQLSDYINKRIDISSFDSTARLWKNYYTDYAPLVDFASTHKIDFVATNVPRRYASKVYKNDFAALDSLTDEEKTWIAPLPIQFDPELPNYVNILSMMGDHASPTLVKAQALKDATMAYSISEFFKEYHLFFHYNGTYHSNNHEGIVWYINHYNNKLKVITIATVQQSDISKLQKEYFNLADFIIVVDEDMTKTF